jgi:hypothetical protein
MSGEIPDPKGKWRGMTAGRSNQKERRKKCKDTKDE